MTLGERKHAGASVSVVIRCYNEIAHIGKVVEAVQAQEHPRVEIVAVDSGSTDGTVETLEDHGVHLVRIPKEVFSFGRSLNMGCDVAQGEFLVFLSAHCYPADGQWVSNLLNGFDADDVAAVYGRQRAVEASAFSEHQIMTRWFPDDSVRRQKEPFLNNANCAVRRAVWAQYPYDEDLPGLEDVAWARTVQGAGWSINYRADATIFHVHNETRAQTKNRYQREAITFQKLFPSEHFNLLDFGRLSARNISADWRAARGEGVLSKHWLDIVGFRLAQFWGTYQGFHTRWPTSSELKRHFYYPNE